MTRAARLILVVAVLGACRTTAQEPAGDQIAATFGDRVVTIDELDARWRAASPIEHDDAMQAVYDGRLAALDAIVADVLIEAAAADRGMTPDELLTQELAGRVEPVPDAEVVAFFNENESQMEGRSFESTRDLIRAFLEEQRRIDARRQFIEELGADGPRVLVRLDPPRHDIPILATDPAIGNADAPVTLVEFSDLQCPFCAAAAGTLRQLRARYGDSLRVVWKDFPLTQVHPDAFRAALAGHCAAEQSQFWAIHDRFFANQDALDDDSIRAHAEAVGLDGPAFESCLNAARYEPRVREGIDLGMSLGVNATPTIFINGRKVSGAQPYEVFASIIDDELARVER